MPSWLPGDDYMTNFKVGDPYVGIDDGYARLPGAGCEALHPELKGLNPEDYPDIHKLRILGDVAPYFTSTTRCLRPAPHKNPRARAPGRSSAPDPALLSARAQPALSFYATPASSSPLLDTSAFIRAPHLSSG